MLSVALGAVVATLTIAQALLVADVLWRVINHGADWAGVMGKVSWLLAVVTARAGVAWLQEELARRTAVRTIAELRRTVLNHAARLGPRWRARQKGYALAPLLTSGLASLHDYLARYLPTLALAALVPAAMVAVVLVTDWLSALIVALTLPLIPVFMALVGWYTDRATHRKFRALAALSGYFADVVGGLPTLWVFGRAMAQARAVRRVTDEHRIASMSTLRIAFLSSLVLELLATLSVAVVAVTIGFRLLYGQLDLRTALVVLILAPEAYLPLRQLGMRFHAAADGVAAVEQVTAILDVPTPPAGTHTDLPALPGLSLEQAQVAYGNGTDPVPLDIEVPAGQVTVLRGPSGVGKSTALSLAAGVLFPDQGRVEISGHSTGTTIDLCDVEPGAWRRLVAWAGQRPAMVPGTIRDNLTLAGDPGDEKLRSACVAVAADEFIDLLPEGWDTPLGDDGAGLSQGQLARLGLARAIVQPAPVLLLDEPTAALDAATEARVIDGLRPYLSGRTVLLATHRAGPERLGNQVVDLLPETHAGGNGIKGGEGVARGEQVLGTGVDRW